MLRTSRPSFLVSVVVGAICLLPSALAAQRIVVERTRTIETFEGAQGASLDQPRIYLNISRTSGGRPLQTQGAEPQSGVEAFLDTGASGVVLSEDTARKLGINRVEGAAFEDVGVGGADSFGVSEPVWISVASYPKADAEDPSQFSKPTGPIRMQLRAGGGLLDMLSPGMDVLGMPLLSGKVIVMDPSGLAKFDKIKTSLYMPGDRNIPKTTRHVPLTMVPFERFTRMTPSNAPGPAQVANPMIGPNPFNPRDARQGVTINYKGKEASGTFLLDTGAATSMISSRMAKLVGLDLTKVPKAEKFSLTVGGIGGAKESSGVYFDKLELPTREGSIVYTAAPLLVADITVQDAKTGQPFTLDGILGMNYLVASVEVSGGLLPDVGKMVNGPYKWIVIDLKNNEMGVEPSTPR
jgi:predicted aspartyl protease